MNSAARIVRTVGGLLLLSHLICFFFPFLCIVQEHHPAKTFSQFWEVRELLVGGIGRGVPGLVVVCIILPMILSMIFGIWGIMGNQRHGIFGVGAILVALLDGGFLWNMQMFFPESIHEAQELQIGFGRYVLMGVAVFCGIFGVMALICELDNRIIKKAGILFDATAESGSAMSKGVMVGLSGIFQGAEIVFQPGETLKLGRGNANHLIFAQADRVSRNHCEITWRHDRGNYQILDYSSNGCFVNGGEECIPKNIVIELKPGTVLDIGDQTNRFWLG